MWRILDNPWLNRAGTAVFIAGASQTGVRWVIGLPLNVVGVALLAAGVFLMLGPRLSKRIKEHEHRGLSPQERRRQIDDQYHPPADPRRELGEDCASMAMKIKVIAELDKEERPVLIDKMVREIRDADPGLDPGEARKQAEQIADRRLVATYKVSLQKEALELFNAAKERGAITPKARRRVEHPGASDLDDLAGMFRAAARRLGYEVAEPDRETHLERWARERLAVADEIRSDSRVGSGDVYYLGAMKKWDLENLEQLAETREDLLVSYRENSRTGEKEPGPRVTVEDGHRTIAPGEWERYFDERVRWLQNAFGALQGREAAG